MSKRSSQLLIEDMMEAVCKIEEYTSGLSLDSFLGDRKTQDAVIRNLQIIGEAAGRMPEVEAKKFNEIEWSKIIGLRNRIVHAYFGIDQRLVWAIIEKDLPEFKKSLSEKNQ